MYFCLILKLYDLCYGLVLYLIYYELDATLRFVSYMYNILKSQFS